jgi:hypothetical protein
MKKLGFSTVSKGDLEHLGVKRGLLVIKKAVLTERLEARGTNEQHMKLLFAQIERIFRFVSMRVSEFCAHCHGNAF